MEYFVADRVGRIFLLRLDPGDYVLESINDLVRREGVRDAIVFSAIGTLDQCILHMVTTTEYPPKEFFRRWRNEPLELASVVGVIADGKPHLHAVVSDSNYAYAGHLEEGCRTLYLAEIVVMEILGANLTRIRDEKNIPRLRSIK